MALMHRRAIMPRRAAFFLGTWGRFFGMSRAVMYHLNGWCFVVVDRGGSVVDGRFWRLFVVFVARRCVFVVGGRDFVDSSFLVDGRRNFDGRNFDGRGEVRKNCLCQHQEQKHRTTDHHCHCFFCRSLLLALDVLFWREAKDTERGAKRREEERREEKDKEKRTQKRREETRK